MTQDRTAARPVAVLGGTGKTGRRIVERLQTRHVPVRAAARGGPHRFDWADPTTWAPVLDGAAAVYVAYAPDLAMPGAPETVARLAAQAHELGVERLVLLSGRGEAEAERAERLVLDAHPARTVVRAAFFAQNFTENFLAQGIADGVVVLPDGTAPEPFVDLEDVADVAAVALTTDAHTGQVLELTGPRSLTFAEAVSEIAAGTRRPVRFQGVPVEEYAAGLTAAGLPRDIVDLLGYLFTEILDGRGSRPTDGVRRVLGRDARDFREFVARDMVPATVTG